MDEVPARPQEGRRLLRDIGHPLGEDQPAIGPAGEPKLLGAEQDAADSGMDAVGGDQDVGFRFHTVVERNGHAIRILVDADTAVRRMHASGRHGLGEQRMQLAAVEDHDAAHRSPFAINVRLQWRSRVKVSVQPSVPAALVEERRAKCHTGAFLAEAEPYQDSRSVRADVDTGANLAQEARLLIDLHVIAGLQQADRGGEPADTAADDGNLELFRSHQATRLPRT